MLKKQMTQIVFFFLVTGMTVSLLAQDRSPIPGKNDLKKLQKEIRASDWFPKTTRDRLNNVSTALLILDESDSEANPAMRYAMLNEAIRLSEISMEPSLAYESKQRIYNKYEVEELFYVDWFDAAIRKYKSQAHVGELVNLFCKSAADHSGTGKISDWVSIQKQLLKKVRQTRSPKLIELWEPSLVKIGIEFELLEQPSKLNVGLLGILGADVKNGLRLLAESEEAEIAEAAQPIVGGKTNFRQYMLLLNALVSSKEPAHVLAARKIFESQVKNLSTREIENGQRICFPSPPQTLTSDFSLPVAGVESSGYLAPIKSQAKNLRYLEAEKAWVSLDSFYLDFPPLPLTNYVNEIELEFAQMDDSFMIFYSFAEPACLRFRRVSKTSSKLSFAHTRSVLGIVWSGGSKEYRPNQKINLRNYNIEGQQFCIENGQFSSENYHGMEWVNLRIVGGRGAQVKITKFNVRPMLPGDKEVVAAVVAGRSTSALKNLDAFDPGMQVEELAKYADANRSVSNQMRNGKAFLNELELTMQPVFPGEFPRGKTAVRINNGFWISKHEVSQRQWCELMKQNPATIQGNSYFPVDNVSYSETIEFCKRLTVKEKKAKRIPDGFVYRIPTEAEWEYVCRAGTTDNPGDNDFWNRNTAEGRFRPIGTGQPNALGVSEMHGNVEEWVADKSHRLNEKLPRADDPFTPPTTERDWIMVKGGTWADGPRRGYADARYERKQDGAHNRGFRVVLAPALN